MASVEAVDALEAALADVGARLNQLHGQLLALVRTALDEGLWEGDGFRSAEHWLALRAGLTPSRAASVVQAAGRSPELPTTLTLLRDGALSLDQVLVIAATVPSTYEASVAELAQVTSVTQLRRAVSRYTFDTTEAVPVDLATTAPAEPVRVVAEEPATLRMSFVDGRFDLHYSAPADQGALAEAALAEAKDALFRAGQGCVTWADAFDSVCSRSVSTAGSSEGSSSRRDAFRVYVHLDPGGAWLGGRPALPRHISDKLTCDGVLQPVWETQGSPVNVGRAQRIVPNRLRRLVEDRDRGCRFPGCLAQAHVEVHHLRHWRDGGHTDDDNLVSLCPHHHDGHHAGSFSMSGDPRRLDALTFHTSGGLVIRSGPTFAAHPGGGFPRDGTSDAVDARAAVDERAAVDASDPPGLMSTLPPPSSTAPSALSPPVLYCGASGEPLHSRLVSFVPSSSQDVQPTAERVA